MKKYIISGIMALVTLLVMGIATAAHTSWHIPNASDKVLDNNDMINISFKNATETEGCNVTFTSATSGSSAVTINLTNMTGTGNTTHQFMANQTWNVGVLKDAGDYAITAICRNVSGAADPDVSNLTSYTVDTTTPTVSANFVPANNTRFNTKSEGTNIRISVNCSNATSATLYIGNSTTETMTETNDNCTFNSTYMWSDGLYNWKVVASDGTNETSSEWYTFNVRKGGSVAAASTSTAGAKGAAADKTITIGGKTFDMKTVFIVAIVLVLLLQGKTKAKKRKRK